MKKFNKENICYIIIGILSITIYLLKMYWIKMLHSHYYIFFITSYLFLILMIYGALKKNDILINTMAIASIPDLFIYKNIATRLETLPARSIPDLFNLKNIVHLIIAFLLLLIFIVEFIKNSKFEIEK